MVVVSGEFEVGTDDREKAVAAALAMAEETRSEAGCLSYRFYADIDRPNVFRVFEEWESGEALEAHFETPHMARFRSALSEIEIVSRDVKRYAVSDTRQL